MERIEPTRRIALRVWWALAWRWALCLLLISLFLGLLTSALVAMFRMSPEAAAALTTACAYLLGLPLMLLASWELLYRIFTKRFDGIEIAVLRRNQERLS